MQIVYRNHEQDQENRLKFCTKNKERDWSDVLITDEASFYILSSGKHRWVASGDSYERTKIKYSQKIPIWGVFSSKGIIKLQFFNANMDSKKFFEILKNCKSDIDNLHLNGILLLWEYWLKAQVRNVFRFLDWKQNTVVRITNINRITLCLSLSQNWRNFGHLHF